MIRCWKAFPSFLEVTRWAGSSFRCCSGSTPRSRWGGWLRDSVLNFDEGVPGGDPYEVMALLMMTLYFEALRDVGAQSNTILLAHWPSAVSDLYLQLRNATTAGNLVAAKSRDKRPESRSKRLQGSRGKTTYAQSLLRGPARMRPRE